MLPQPARFSTSCLQSCDGYFLICVDTSPNDFCSKMVKRSGCIELVRGLIGKFVERIGHVVIVAIDDG